MLNTVTAALNTTEVNPIGTQAPEWVELVPAGEVIGRDGRRWVNSNPSAVLQAFQTSGADLPVDLEHSTELKAPKGEAAPAVGWVQGLKLMGGAIWGRIAWNRTGSQLVATRQYRYLSPVILYGKSNGIIAALTSVALTNRPNLHLQALNHQGDAGSRVGLPRALDADEQKICYLMNVSEEEYVQAAALEGHEQGASALASALSADERKICRLMGVSEEEYLQAKI